MVRPTVHTGPRAAARLNEFGLRFEDFEASFKYGLDEAATCTDKDVSFCKGTLLYSRIGRRLQEILEPADWQDSRPHNQKSVLHFGFGIRVLHLTGNGETGNADPRAVVAPARPGGQARRDLIAKNTEPTVLGKFDPSTWFLLYKLGSATLRSELSYTETPPDDEDEYHWIERIVLPEVELPPGLRAGDEDLVMPPN
ncbi:hypothetical protein [Glycomyces arizonensis]|uniref:hypothetical protein n=1 Tax=Glycomyces arizonensis TaxID=256035 RepID=UPI0003FD10D5|nr:hypothetical protein [Glycomyces arizonensis]